MANYKEIVTKAVIGKGKKNFTTTQFVTPEIMPTTILGCWVINHNFSGYKQNNNIVIEGNYDVNIWYSCLNDTKTEVVRKSDTYKEIVSSPKIATNEQVDNEQIVIRSLKEPTCIKTEIEDGKIKYTIEKELGVEIVGDTKVKIATEEDDDNWENINDVVDDKNVQKEIDDTVKEDFLD